jgi:hypothetical protein
LAPALAWSAEHPDRLADTTGDPTPEPTRPVPWYLRTRLMVTNGVAMLAIGFAGIVLALHDADSSSVGPTEKTSYPASTVSTSIAPIPTTVMNTPAPSSMPHSGTASRGHTTQMAPHRATIPTESSAPKPVPASSTPQPAKHQPSTRQQTATPNTGNALPARQDQRRQTGGDRS